MKKIIVNKIKQMDQKIKKIIANGSYFSLSICLASAIVLFTYEMFYASPDLYYIGLSIFKMGITFLAAFFACGFAFNEIQKELG